MEAGKAEFAGFTSGMFFDALLQITMEGFFADPIYGGNRDMAAWKMVGYPGLPATYREDVQEIFRQEIRQAAALDRGLFLRQAATRTDDGETIMATLLKEVDAVVIGVGWTGSILARELTKAGLQVVGLERGAKRTPREDFTMPSVRDELKYVHRHELFQDTQMETVTLRHSPSETALPIRRLGSFLPGNNLGGAGSHWNGNTWRLLPTDHKLRSHLTERYGAQRHSRRDDDRRTIRSAMTSSSPITTSSKSCAAFPARPAICAARRSTAATSSKARAATNIPTSR